MRQILIDLLAVLGFSGVAAGLWLQFGMPVALMVGGGLLLLAALVANRKGVKSAA